MATRRDVLKKAKALRHKERRAKARARWSNAMAQLKRTQAQRWATLLKLITYTRSKQNETK